MEQTKQIDPRVSSSLPVADEEESWREGVKAGIPVAVGYLPIAITFGMLAETAGLSPWIAVAMSLIVYAGASQFVGVTMLASGAAPLAIVFTTFILNFRHFLMSSALTQKINPTLASRVKAITAFGITDETFAVASLHRSSRTLSVPYLLGLNAVAYLSWNCGTWAGLLLSSGLPELVKSSMGISLYVMFLALLVPGVKTSRPALMVAVLAALVQCAFTYIPIFAPLSSSVRVILSTLIAAGAGAWLTKEVPS
ncbi:AzlC family ABC transporter permease [Gorillibacterium sp. CAU 1737]|uniref:AzlC family ABC transporter permease n=1 Tax=Gorillibacterium sp. CAU 1737 TaxID=3140362 RepID=UPI00326073CE